MDQETADILKRMADLLRRHVVLSRASDPALYGDIVELQKDIAKLAGGDDERV